MVIPDRVVQAERLVAVAPAIARAGIFLDNDGGHAELAQPGAERDAALAAADDQHVGLGLVSELLALLIAQFLPALGAGMDAVPGTERPGETGLFLVSPKLDHGRQQRPDLAVLQADQSKAARGLGLERDPALGYPAGLGRALALGNFEVARFHSSQAMREHVANCFAAFHGLDVPGKGNQVAPVAFGREQGHGGVEIAGLKRSRKCVEKSLDACVKRGVEHGCLPNIVFVCCTT